MTVVIDIGSATYGGDSSIPHLIVDYCPTTLYGFDPGEVSFSDVMEGGTRVLRIPSAAWTYDGEVGFVVAGLGGHVSPGEKLTPCVDLARFIHDLGSEDIVLKMDAEEAEYILIPHLVERDADKRLRLFLIEWHCEVCKIGGNGRHRDFCTIDKVAWRERRERVEGMLRCPTGEWNR